MPHDDSEYTTELDGPVVPIIPQVPHTGLADLPASAKMLLVALSRIEKAVSPLARGLIDLSHTVDEYSTEASTVDNLVSFQVFPEYDKFAERIDGVIVTGPPNAPFTLALGDRTWNVLTDSKGLFQVVHAGILLARNDLRVLTATGPATPNFPATGVDVFNPYSYPVEFFLNANGATITTVTVNGVAITSPTNFYVIPPYGTVAVAYTGGTPSWQWTLIAGLTGNWTLELTGFADERYYAP